MKSSSSSFISFASPRTLADDACGGCNTGICVEPSPASSTNTTNTNHSSSSTTTSTTIGNKPSCDCRNTGYVGEHCQIPCSKQCRNGGKCVPPTRIDATTQTETCACAKAVVDGNPYAGIHCEYGATQSCMTLGSASKHSFCTNGGQCVEIVGDNEAHVPCDCPDGYVGDKCEYRIGNVPLSYSNSTWYASSSSSSESSVEQQQQQQQQQQSENQSVIFFAVILVMGAMIIIVILGMVVRAYKRKRDARRQEREARRATEDLSMVPMRDRRRDDDGDDIDDAADEEEDGII